MLVYVGVEDSDLFVQILCLSVHCRFFVSDPFPANGLTHAQEVPKSYLKDIDDLKSLRASCRAPRLYASCEKNETRGDEPPIESPVSSPFPYPTFFHAYLWSQLQPRYPPTYNRHNM